MRLPEAAPGTTFTAADVLVARFLPDGSPDATFETNGEVVLPFGAGGATETVESVAIDAEGRVLIAGMLAPVPGSPTTLGGPLGCVARLTVAGAPDRTFGGGDGLAEVDFGDASASAFGNRQASPSAVALQGDGKILVGGTHVTPFVADATDAIFGVARFNADGTPDPTFGGREGRRLAR